MRQIVLDTETTGLDPKLGHRIIEIACIELENRRLTARHLHRYINPERAIDEGAQAVHGISSEFLSDKPLFAEIASELIEFVRGAELVIHNAAFDTAFINSELARLDLPRIETVCSGVLDTLKLARELHPGKRNNLDALCERYQISNAHRTFHGALLDTELLANVYLAMTRGQERLVIPSSPTGETSARRDTTSPRRRDPLLIVEPDAEDLAAHAAILDAIDKEAKGPCLWRRGAAAD